MDSLTEGAIATIMSGGEVIQPVVQILGNKAIPGQGSNERYRLLISDGVHLNSFAMLATQLTPMLTSGELSDNSIVKITNHVVSTVKNSGKGEKRIMVILGVEVIKNGAEVGARIGNPVPYTEGASAPQPAPAPPAPAPVQPPQKAHNGYSRKSMNETTFNSPMPTTMTHPIASLSPYQNSWVIKARVTAKSNVRQWSNARSEGKLFSVDLVDGSGEIRATAFRDQVDKFYDLMEVNKVYFISKCQVKLANKQYSSLKNDYEMSFTNDTKVVPCTEDDVSIPSMQYNFVSINSIADSKAGDLVDFIGICKACDDVVTIMSRTTNKELKKRNLTIVDPSQASIALTLWGEQAENFNGDGQPVLAVKGAKVGDFGGGRSASLLMSSVLQINPDIPEAHKIRGWFDCLTGDANFHSLSSKMGGDTGAGGKYYTLQEALSNQLGCGDKADYFNCYATLMHAKSEKSLYKACPSPDCQKKVIDQNDGMYSCEKCNKRFETFKYRMMLNVSIGDFSGNQWVTLFQDSGEELLGITADKLGHLQEENEAEYNEVFKRVTLHPFLFRLRAKMENFNDERRLKMSAVSVKKPDYKEQSRRLITEIKELAGVTIN